MRKAFPKQKDREFNIRICRNTLKATCERLCLGKYDRKPKIREGLTPHDFRRTSARNLVKGGANHRPAMKITDHKTEAILEGRKIKWTDDGKEALIKMGECTHAAVTPIAQTSGSR